MEVRHRAVLAATVFAGFCLVASAVAAVRQGENVDRSGKGPNAVIDLNVPPSGTEVQPTFYNKCSKFPVPYLVKIQKNGNFSFKGTKPDINGKNVKISIVGDFGRHVTGTVDYDSAGCKGKPVDFDAKYEGLGT